MKRFPIYTVTAGALLILSATTTDTELVATLAFILAAILAIGLDYMGDKVHRHQKAIEWFTNHIYLRNFESDPDTPEDLLDIVGKED